MSLPQLCWQLYWPAATAWWPETCVQAMTPAARACAHCASVWQATAAWSWALEPGASAPMRCLPCSPALCTAANVNGAWRRRRTVWVSTGAFTSQSFTVSGWWIFCIVLKCGKTHTGTGRTCKPHTGDSNPWAAELRTCSPQYCPQYWDILFFFFFLTFNFALLFDSSYFKPEYQLALRTPWVNHVMRHKYWIFRRLGKKNTGIYGPNGDSSF